MQYKDYYSIMGVNRDASAEEIKRAYRKLARKYHPDVSKEAQAEERFKELGEAYEVLKDPQKRANYDQLGADWKAGQEFKPPPQWQWDTENNFEFTGGDSDQFSDFFASLFGRSGRAADFRTQRPHGTRTMNLRGEDLNSKIFITLEDAYHGTTKTLELSAPEVMPDGSLQAKLRMLKVKIPAGITEGQKIRLAGQGGHGIGSGPNGDLYLEIAFDQHPYLHAEKADVYLTLPITPWEAALGASIPVPTLGGKVEVKIPPASQTGQKLRLKGRGLPAKPPGDQYVTLQVIAPPAETPAAKNLYQQMAEQIPFNPREKMGV